MPTKGPRSKRASRSALNRNTGVAVRLDVHGYTSDHAARFLKSVEAAKTLAIAANARAEAHPATIAALAAPTDLVIRGVGKLLALCRYFELDTAPFFEVPSISLARLRSRSPPTVIDAAAMFTLLLSHEGTRVPEAIHNEARLLMQHVQSAEKALKARDASTHELAQLRKTLAAAVKDTSDDLMLLAAELRHADTRLGTNWSERILEQRPRPHSRRPRARQIADKPAENAASKTPAAQMAPASATPSERPVPAANASPPTPGDSASQLSATAERAFSYTDLNEAPTHRQPAKPVG